MSTPKIIPLWDGPAPHSNGSTENDIPTLTAFIPENVSAGTPAIIIFPGGGYGALAFEHEGIHIAGWFAQRGVAAFVLKYRLPVNGYRHPVPMLDAQRAIRYVRSHAAEWKIDPARIGIMGFSAGGHLAATVDTHFDAGSDLATNSVDKVSSRPSFAVLVYAVVSFKEGVTHSGSKAALLGPNPDPALVENLSNETQVTPQTPPTLLLHSIDDGPVPIENSRSMLAALQKAGVASALYEYPLGGHGWGYWPDRKNAHTDGWLERTYAWLKAQGFSS